MLRSCLEPIGKFSNMKENILYSAILSHLSLHGIKGDDAAFRHAQGSGIEMLFKNKKHYKDRQSIKTSFFEAKERVMELDIDHYKEDLILEMESVILNYDTRLPEFWSSFLDEIRNDECFQRYYTK